MIKTKVKQKQKTIVQTIDSVRIKNINFINENMNVLLDFYDDNDNLVDNKSYIYDIQDFSNIVDRLLKRILKDADLKLLDEAYKPAV